MGACNKSEVPDFASYAKYDRRVAKQVLDNVHGNIYLDPLFLKFVDTAQFQRLRDLKQLGVTNMVYPGAVHTRFEHSLGVYWLAGEAVHQLRSNQGMELDIDRFDIQAVKLAGLLHDVGHGPFSHMFERELLPRILHHSNWSHEDMSVRMIDYIVDEHHIDIDDGIVKKAKEMILSSGHDAPTTTAREKRFLYDIVANGRNGIDVDKFDYIARDSRACGLGCNFKSERLLETMRVIGDEICYRAKEYLTIHKLFLGRADLHRTVYTHPKVKAIELMISDALLYANESLEFHLHVDDPAQYWKLSDSIVKSIEYSSAEELKDSRDLISRIRKRDLYKFCNEFAVPKDKLDRFKHVTVNDIICSQTSGNVTLKEEDVVVSNVNIDLTRGRINPLGSINFFEDYESEKKFTIEDNRVSHLLPGCCQDRIVRVYAKKPELVEAVSEAFENYQLKVLGMKAQVHPTPEKKKRRRVATDANV